jgi:hypothetical protein
MRSVDVLLKDFTLFFQGLSGNITDIAKIFLIML